MDHGGLAAGARRVVDPDLDFGGPRPGRSAGQVERVSDTIRSDDAATRTGEGVGFLRPAIAVRAHEAEPLGVATRIGVLHVEVDPYTLLGC